jgi:hypothetical protein
MKYQGFILFIMIFSLFLLSFFPLVNDFPLHHEKIKTSHVTEHDIYLKILDPLKKPSFIPFFRWGEKEVMIEYTEKVINPGIERVNITTYLAIPPSLVNQEINEIEYSPMPDEFRKDKWGQDIATYSYSLQPGETTVFSFTTKARIFNIRYLLLPFFIRGNIPEEIHNVYTVDDEKYKIYHPLIQNIVQSTVNNTTNVLIKAIRLHDYVIDTLEYALEGGWDDAPTVLKRGDGSCSEYCFAYISLCRAAGIPARYKGGTYLGEDPPHTDEIFHRMVEIYLPGYGWIPVDMTFNEWILHHYAFGAHTNKFFGLMIGGGSSEFLDWSYKSYHIYPPGYRIRTYSSATWYEWN